ncbi:TPA: transposase, partial [Yersinia enterocolitica]|nr:transposase [Yersinia enterocolitica]
MKQAEAGTPVSKLCRKHGMSNASFSTWAPALTVY